MNLRVRIYVLFFLSLIVSTGLYAQDTTKTVKNLQKKSHKKLKFVDKNGDGYNDNAPDHDGDGVPDELDPDWQKLMKRKNKHQKSMFVDLNGDGINDNLQQNLLKQKKQTKILKQGNGSSIESKQQKQRGSGKKKKGGKG